MGIETGDVEVYEKLVKGKTGYLKILAEGDSWFAYPRQFLLVGRDANVINHLADKPNLLILNTSSVGDEIVDMMSGDQKFSLLKRLSRFKFDIVLLSGGGNDIVGRYDFGFFLKERKPGTDWKACINLNRLNLKLKQIELSYRELVERILDTVPDIRIVTHTYGLALPSTVGFELFDIIPLGKSWMYPYLVQKKIDDREDQRKIVRHIMVKSKNTLFKVQKDYQDRFKVVDTQGLLKEEHWLNEIHPTSEGFGLVAEKIYDEGILANEL